jgi:lipopolysaccharide/colanic/teichoic acid biosynthesis glycosyltransferase
MPRFFEFIIALFGLLVLSPILFIIALLIKVDSRGPVFYRANRIGYKAKTITVFKFRTMRHDINNCGLPVTTQKDDRITIVGRILRRTKLDELPQLINVLKGDMRFVGPRPEDPKIVKRYNAEQRKILDYKPGITSPASIKYRNEETSISSDRWEDIYFGEILPDKISTDLNYFRGAGFWSEMRIIFETMGIKIKNEL